MNWKKVVALGLTVLATAAILAGCGGDTKKADAGKTELPKKIVVGLDDNYPPMGFRDKDGNIVGFDIDMAKEAAKRAGTEIEFKSIDWASKEAELSSKRIDVLWNGLTMTEERKKNMLFSNPYMNNKQVLVVPVDSPIQSVADLKDKVVGMQDGSTAVTVLERNPDMAKTFKETKKYSDMVTALIDSEAKRADAVILDDIIAFYYIKQKPGTLRVVPADFGAEKIAIGYRLGDTALKEKIDSVLADMKKDGTSKKISEKWFGEDLVL